MVLFFSFSIFFIIQSKYSKRSVNKAKLINIVNWENGAFFVCSLESIESNTDCSQSNKNPQYHPEEWVCLDHGPTELEHCGRLGVRCPNLRLVYQKILHFLQILKDLDSFDKEWKNPCEMDFLHYPPSMSPPYLNVELEGSEGLLQHRAPLLLRQLHAVHPAAVQLLEQVGAGDAREGKEPHTVAAGQL